ncbi:MAG: mechanosensitive ion channel domain-containing protein, partial [Chromatiaceae bacterium]
MNTLLAMKIPHRVRLFMGCWALLLAFLLPFPLPAATDDASATDWTAKRLEVEQRLALAMANVESVQAQLRQDPEPVRSQTRPTAKLVRIREGFVNVYKAELDAIHKLENQHLALRDARKALAEWQPPAGAPPWPLTQGDAVRIALFQARETLTQLASRVEEQQSVLAEARKQRDRLQVKSLQEEEKSLAEDPSPGAGSPSAVELDRLETELADEVIYLQDLLLKSVKQESELKDIEAQRLQRQLDHFAGRFALSAVELATINREYDRQAEHLRELEIQVRADLAETRLQVDGLRAEMAASTAGAGAATLDKADIHGKLEIALAEQERIKFHAELYRVRIALLDGRKQLWEVRAKLYSADKPDHAEMIELAGALAKFEADFGKTRRFLTQEIDANSQQAYALRKELLLDPDEAERDLLTARYEAATSQASDAREGLEDLKELLGFVRIVASEIDRMYRSGSPLLWLQNAWVQSGVWARAVWNYELLPVEDTLMVEGREIRATRSVTVGKSIGAVLILIGGYLVIARAIRLIFALLVARLDLSAATASLVQRWLRLIAVATLVLISVAVVDIPVKIFAFMGGALVLAFGFGAQTLLKNLISGVMLLAERPVRVGDLVEVGNVRGRITTIGIRVSTILTSQGMDMLIPNSMLVEDKLINWTYSTPEMRWELKVGVAYGSDVKAVTAMLVALALAHPEVSKEPKPPMVLFEDFGDSALIFTLRYWLKMEPGRDERRVASELRYAILEALTEAKVSIPFAERNLHLTTDAPIEIRLQRGRA